MELLWRKALLLPHPLRLSHRRLIYRRHLLPHHLLLPHPGRAHEEFMPTMVQPEPLEHVADAAARGVEDLAAVAEPVLGAAGRVVG